MKYIPYIIFSILWIVSLQEIGIVGEVYSGISYNSPVVIQQTIPNFTETCTHESSFTFCESRPLLSVHSLPLLINMYTGGIYDWPARILFSLTNSFLSIQIFYGLCAIGIIGLTGLITRDIVGSNSYIATFFLSIHPCFLLYKKILGGTEIALQIGLLLFFWGVFSINKNERSHIWIYLGTIFAVFAKWVSVIPILICVVYLILYRRFKTSFTIIAICVVIISTMYLINQQVPNIIRSHDDFQMQWNRLIDTFYDPQRRPSREHWLNLFYFFSIPFLFFSKAYKANLPVGYIWTSMVSSMCWIYILISLYQRRGRVMLMALISILMLTAIAKDLHHLAMMLPILAIGVEEVTQQDIKIRQFLLLTLFTLGYGLHIIQGDRQLMSITTPTFGWSKQMKMLERLQANKVQRLITMDYEIYGVIEMLDPQIDVIHTWGAISHEGYDALPQIIQRAKGGHMIVCESSMSMIYNLHPPLSLLRSKSQELSIEIEPIDKWDGVILYEVK